MADTVYWRIIAGPESVDAGSVRGEATGMDAVAWKWVLEAIDDADRVHYFYCIVSNHVNDASPEVSRLARDTQGRSEVEKILTHRQPDRVVTVASQGYMDLG